MRGSVLTFYFYDPVGICSDRRGAGGLSQRRGVGSSISGAAAQTKSKTRGPVTGRIIRHSCLALISELSLRSYDGTFLYLFFSRHRRSRRLWKKKHPVRATSRRCVRIPTTETSTATWLAPPQPKMQHTHWKPTKHTDAVSVTKLHPVERTRAPLAIISLSLTSLPQCR